MRTSHRRRKWRRGVVWLGILSLVALALAVITGWIPLPVWLGANASPDTPTTAPPQTLEPTLIPGVLTPRPETHLTLAPSLDVTLIGPMTPADRWANVLLDRVRARLQQPGPPGDGFAWWQGQEAIGLLTYADGTVSFQGSRLSLDDRGAVVVYIISPADPNQLQRVARIQADSSVLVLSVDSLQPGHADTQWILGSSSPDVALQALVIQVAARSMVLKAAYSPGDNGVGDIVLIGAEPLSGPVPTSTGAASPTLTTTAPPTLSPTPTRAPEADLGVMIQARLKPVFDAGLSFPPDVVKKYTASHAWNGSLTWDETGPLVDGRPVNVDQAGELVLQILTPNDPRGPAQPFLKAEYTGVVTRFPDEQIYFSGQRMNEVLYWTVYSSARRGGLLSVSYDDFGARQLITIFGFTPFSQSQTGTPKP